MADITSLTVAQVAKTTFGNKKVIVADITIVNSGALTWPTAGLALTPSALGLDHIDLVLFDGGQAVYKWASNVMQAYVCGTAGAAQILVVATGAVVNETVRCIAIGWGG